MSISIRRRCSTMIAILVILSLGLVACGDDSEPAATGRDVDPNGEGDDDGPGDTDTPILIIDNEGAFTTREMAFSQVPQLVVYSDGRVIQPGAQIMIYPGPALPALFQSQITEDGLDALVEAMREAELGRTDVDYGTTNIADAGDTVVTVRIDGAEYTHRAQALGVGVAPLGEEPADTPDEGPEGMLTDDQREARELLFGFVNSATDLAGLVGPDEIADEKPFVAERYRLWVQSASEVPAPDDQVQPDETEWTVDTIDLEATECLAVEGDAATELTVLLSDANQLTRFVDEGTAWAVVARPVLPHEPTCPDA